MTGVSSWQRSDAVLCAVQVTLLEPPSGTFSSTGDAPEDRRVGVAAPKMFAFDAIYTDDDAQVSCSLRRADGPLTAAA